MPVAIRRSLNTSRARRPAAHDDEDEPGPSAHAGSSATNGRHRNEEDDADDDSTTNALTSSSSGTAQAPLTASQVQQQVTGLLEEFERQSHPLTRNEHDVKLKSMHAEWKSSENRVTRAMQLISNLAERKADMANAIEDDLYGIYSHPDRGAAEQQEALERENEDLKELDAKFSGLIDVRESIERSRTVLQELRTQLDAGDVTDAAGQYERNVEERTAAYNHKSRRARYGHNKEYEEFKERIWSAQHGNDEPMPPLVELLEAEDGRRINEGAEGEAQGGADEDEESDEDIVAYGASTAQTYKCPLSQQIMVNPVKSTVCTHAFEKEAIEAYLGRHSSRNCPQCSARLSRSTLQEDANFTRACRNHARRQERRRARERMQTQATFLD